MGRSKKAMRGVGLLEWEFEVNAVAVEILFE
jgi:hypothetical protein